MVQFVVPGDPVAKGRPRVTMRGKHAHAYTPKKTVAFENKVALFAQDAGVERIDGPVCLNVVAIFARPNRLRRKKDPDGRMPCALRADVDNIAKAVADGLNGIAYADDKQVHRLVVSKYYGCKDADMGCTIVRVESLADCHRDRQITRRLRDETTA